MKKLAINSNFEQWGNREVNRWIFFNFQPEFWTIEQNIRRFVKLWHWNSINCFWKLINALMILQTIIYIMWYKKVWYFHELNKKKQTFHSNINEQNCNQQWWFYQNVAFIPHAVHFLVNKNCIQNQISHGKCSNWIFNRDNQ